MYVNFLDIQNDLKNGKITCQALVKHYLQNIEKHKNLNAFIEVFGEAALKQAHDLDLRIANQQPVGKLAGMVLGIKDLICYKNHHVSAGSGILQGFESLFSATAVERLIAQDAIILGRLNCDEFGMGSTNEYSYYGSVKNALNPQKVAGGSSGGSAVAVQADMCLASLGTDTGGSVRQPASFCGLLGLKPTYSRISRHGLIAYASSFDQIGIFAHSAYNAALLLETMAGNDHFDATASLKPVPAYSQKLQFEKQKAKIAYFENALNSKGIDPEIAQKTQQLIAQLKANGHEVSPINFKYLDYIVPTYYILTTAEASSNLARYDGIRYGYKSPQANSLQTTYTHSRTQGFGSEVKRRIMLGTFVLSAGYYDAYYAKAQKVRQLISKTTQQIFETYDFILTPTTPTTAFDLGSKALQNPVTMYIGDIFTVQANLAGIPAISIPLGWHNTQQLPFGIQLMAQKYNEADLLAFSNYLLNNYEPNNQ